MKIINLAIQEVQESVQEADFCIVGSGAAGLPLCQSLVEKGYSVILCESGDNDITDRNQKFNELELSGTPHKGSLHDRYRVFGGSTMVWGGQAMRFRGHDLGPRPWVNQSAWPVSYDEISGDVPQIVKTHGGWLS